MSDKRDEIKKLLEDKFNTYPNYEDALPEEMFQVIKHCAENNYREGISKMMEISTTLTRKECIEGALSIILTREQELLRRVREPLAELWKDSDCAPEDRIGYLTVHGWDGRDVERIATKIKEALSIIDEVGGKI